MPDPAVTTTDPSAEFTVDLKDRWFAAFLAWLFPGGGHFYQGRWGKGWLFCICIMGTFCSGMYFGGGKVVYASWGPAPEQKRLYYFLQIGVGAPALPALMQAQREPPHPEETSFWRRFMAPPYIPPNAHYTDAEGHVYRDELAKWHHVYGEGFEMGTIYTAIAGLLNLLVVFDAWGGPLMIRADDRKKKPPQPDPAAKPAGGKPPGETPQPAGAN